MNQQFSSYAISENLVSNLRFSEDSPYYAIYDNFGRDLTGNDNSLDLDLAMEVHKYFRLTKVQAEQIISEVKQAVQSWRTIATKHGISKGEQDLKRLAFSKSEDYK